METNISITVDTCICMGSSCFSRGNNKTLEIIKEYLLQNKLENSVNLRGSLCEGNCKNGPNLSINGVSYDNVDKNSIIDILEHHLKPFREV